MEHLAPEICVCIMKPIVNRQVTIRATTNTYQEYDKWGLSFPLNGYILNITREGNIIPKWLCASVYVMGCVYYTATRHGDATRDKSQSTWSTGQNTGPQIQR